MVFAIVTNRNIRVNFRMFSSPPKETSYPTLPIKSHFTTVLRHFISLPLLPIPVTRWEITEMLVLSLGWWKPTEHKLSGVARILLVNTSSLRCQGITGCRASNVSPKTGELWAYLFSTLRPSFTLLGLGSEHQRTTHVSPNVDSHYRIY